MWEGWWVLWKDWKLLLSVIPYFESFKNFQLIQLSSDSQEYRKIESLFEKTMKNYCIDQLQRIQNPTLWDIFRWFVSILLHYSYCMRRLVFPDLLSSIVYIWSCQIQQSSRGEATTYLSAQVWLVAQAYACPKTWFPGAPLGQSWKGTGAPLSVTGLLGLHLPSFVCVEMSFLSLARCVCDSCYSKSKFFPFIITELWCFRFILLVLASFT